MRTHPEYARLWGETGDISCQVVAPVEKVGSELESILKKFGLTPSKTCGCASRVQRMNDWGIKGCLANRGEIEDWLREEAKKVGWWTKLRAGLFGIVGGILVGKVNPLDPAPGLLDLAIQMVEEKKGK